MTRIFSTLFLIAALLLPGLPARAAPAVSNASGAVPLDHLPALRGDYFRIVSDAVDRPFHIYVRLPTDYEAKPEERFPVVYLLDGDSLFPILATHHLFLTYDEELPEAIVVGIAYGSFEPSVNRRNVDFTGPMPGLSPDEAGAPAFQRFLETELLPAVEQRYRADPARRILFGQSHGGSFVLYSAFTRPDLFWGRIASNPSFKPDAALFHAKPATAIRQDLGLVVTSGSRDRPGLREEALRWFGSWKARTDAPWAIETVTIEGGTHAANSADSYRAAMLWLFGRGAESK